MKSDWLLKWINLNKKILDPDVLLPAGWSHGLTKSRPCYQAFCGQCVLLRQSHGRSSVVTLQTVNQRFYDVTNLVLVFAFVNGKQGTLCYICFDTVPDLFRHGKGLGFSLVLSSTYFSPTDFQIWLNRHGLIPRFSLLLYKGPPFLKRDLNGRMKNGIFHWNGIGNFHDSFGSGIQAWNAVFCSGYGHFRIIFDY